MFVTDRELILGDRTLALVDGDGNLEAAAVERHLVGSLFDVLAESADREKAMARDGDWPARVVLVLDAGTRFRTIVDVMYTAGRAEFVDYAIVAVNDEGQVGALGIEPPRFSFHHEEPEPGPRLEVLILEDDGYRVVVQGQSTSTTIARKDGALDYAALAERAAAHRAEHGEALAVLSAENPIRTAEFVRSAQALLGPGCGAGEDCILGGLIIEAGAG